MALCGASYLTQLSNMHCTWAAAASGFSEFLFQFFNFCRVLLLELLLDALFRDLDTYLKVSIENVLEAARKRVWMPCTGFDSIMVAGSPAEQTQPALRRRMAYLNPFSSAQILPQSGAQGPAFMGQSARPFAFLIVSSTLVATSRKLLTFHENQQYSTVLRGAAGKHLLVRIISRLECVQKI